MKLSKLFQELLVQQQEKRDRAVAKAKRDLADIRRGLDKIGLTLSHPPQLPKGIVLETEIVCRGSYLYGDPVVLVGNMVFPADDPKFLLEQLLEANEGECDEEDLLDDV